MQKLTQPQWKRHFLFFITLSLSLLTCACQETISNKLEPTQINTPFNNDLKTFINNELISSNISGMAVGLAKNGVILYTDAFGYANIKQKVPVTTSSIFPIASITKIFTAASIMQLVDAGHIKLDDPIAPHLDFKITNPYHPKDQITFRHLLMHTSSLSDQKAYEVDLRTHGGDTSMSLETLLKEYLLPNGKLYDAKKCFSSEKAGEKWGYSNIGYSLLGYLAQRITNKKFDRLIRKTIFIPLRLNHMYWTISETPKMLSVTPYSYRDGKFIAEKPVGFPDAPAGMLRGSVIDVLKFASASANHGIHNNMRILTSRSAHAMLEMKKINGLPPYLNAHGLAWSASKIEDTYIPSHWGGDPGVFTAAYADSKSKTAVVILMNNTATQENRNSLRKIVAKLVKISNQF